MTRTDGAPASESTVGEPPASDDFSAFYTTHYSTLMGSLLLYTADRELAADLAQEAMARAYRDWRRVSGLDSPRAWLHRVAFNLANSTFRRRLVERRSRLRSGAPDVHHDADVSDAIVLRAAVSALPARQRTALVLRYFADLSIADTSQAMGCAEGTVRALTSQGLSALRRSGIAVDEESEA